MPDEAALNVVGKQARRKDAWEKVTGRAQYSTDMTQPGMLHAKVLRSPHAHARVVSIDASAARAMPGVHAVLTRDELDDSVAPTYGYFIKDQPIVAIDNVRYEGDTVAAVAAIDEATANRALATIQVEYEPLPAVPDIESALAEDAPELFEEAPMGIVPGYGQGASGALRPRKNVCYRFSYETGTPDAFAGCDHVFEDEFRFSRMHHLHLEPFVTVADWKPGGRIEVTTTCQNPFGLRKELGRIFKQPKNNISVRVPFIGGGYGAKNQCKAEPIAIMLFETFRPAGALLHDHRGRLPHQHATRGHPQAQDRRHGRRHADRPRERDISRFGWLLGRQSAGGREGRLPHPRPPTVSSTSRPTAIVS